MKSNSLKYFVNIIAIIIVILLIWGIVQIKEKDKPYPFKGRIERFFDQVKQFVKIKKHNINMETSPPRRRPLTFIKKEETLRLFAPDPFEEFGPDDWRFFWDIFYEPIKEKQGKFMVKRYRTEEEIKIYLTEEYPNPFSYFKPVHWSYFWEIVWGR
jgi:hypothetical protein